MPLFSRVFFPPIFSRCGVGLLAAHTKNLTVWVWVCRPLVKVIQVLVRKVTVESSVASLPDLAYYERCLISFYFCVVSGLDHINKDFEHIQRSERSGPRGGGVLGVSLQEKFASNKARLT
jgi:hypothetical protein